jgi:hypothetical protein
MINALRFAHSDDVSTSRVRLRSSTAILRHPGYAEAQGTGCDATALPARNWTDNPFHLARFDGEVVARITTNDFTGRSQPPGVFLSKRTSHATQPNIMNNERLSMCRSDSSRCNKTRVPAVHQPLDSPDPSTLRFQTVDTVMDRQVRVLFCTIDAASQSQSTCELIVPAGQSSDQRSGPAQQPSRPPPPSPKPSSPMWWSGSRTVTTISKPERCWRILRA